MHFTILPLELRSGDLVVVNNSATLPASVVIDADLVVHFSTVLPGGLHVVELRSLSGANSLPHEDPRAGMLTLPGGGMIELLTPYPEDAPGRRLWVATADLGRPLSIIWRPGVGPFAIGTPMGPIRWMHTRRSSPGFPGSAEMPSAGRPFTDRLLTALAATAGSPSPR